MNKLKLITSALVMCGLVGTAYAGDPNILPLHSPIIPLQRICTLEINAKLWPKPYRYTFQIKNGATDANIVTFSPPAIDPNGANPSISFNCMNMPYFWVEGKYYSDGSTRNKLVGTDCGNGPFSCDSGYKWKYWSFGLSTIKSFNFVLNSTKSPGDPSKTQMCVNNGPKTSTGTCS